MAPVFYFCFFVLCFPPCCIPCLTKRFSRQCTPRLGIRTKHCRRECSWARMDWIFFRWFCFFIFHYVHQVQGWCLSLLYTFHVLTQPVLLIGVARVLTPRNTAAGSGFGWTLWICFRFCFRFRFHRLLHAARKVDIVLCWTLLTSLHWQSTLALSVASPRSQESLLLNAAVGSSFAMCISFFLSCSVVYVTFEDDHFAGYNFERTVSFFSFMFFVFRHVYHMKGRHSRMLNELYA